MFLNLKLSMNSYTFIKQKNKYFVQENIPAETLNIVEISDTSEV